MALTASSITPLTVSTLERLYQQFLLEAKDDYGWSEGAIPFGMLVDVLAVGDLHAIALEDSSKTDEVADIKIVLAEKGSVLAARVCVGNCPACVAVGAILFPFCNNAFSGSALLLEIVTGSAVNEAGLFAFKGNTNVSNGSPPVLTALGSEAAIGGTLFCSAGRGAGFTSI